MRLFLLPLSTRRSLLYCQRVNQQLIDQKTFIDKLTARSTALWLKWESSEINWQKRTVAYGNKLFERIPYEEWALKSIPPLSTRRKTEDLGANKHVRVTYAPSVTESGKVDEILRTLATERQGLHSKWMWLSLWGMPLTIPFGLLPIIPNLPFFYLVFRAWSHWRALRGSQHLEFLLKHNLVKPEASSTLDVMYAMKRARALSPPPETLTNSEPNPSLESPGAEEIILLDETDGKAVAEAIEQPEAGVEVERAVRQIKQARIAEAKAEEKQKLQQGRQPTDDAATTKDKIPKR